MLINALFYVDRVVNGGLIKNEKHLIYLNLISVVVLALEYLVENETLVPGKIKIKHQHFEYILLQ